MKHHLEDVPRLARVSVDDGHGGREVVDAVLEKLRPEKPGVKVTAEPDLQSVGKKAAESVAALIRCWSMNTSLSPVERAELAGDLLDSLETVTRQLRNAVEAA